MPSYKLYYFDATGRAETARMMFVLAGKEFEDVRLGGEAWQKAKPGMPMGQMPVLEVDGEKIGQSLAIYSYLAREFGFYGNDAIHTARIDEIVGCLEDLGQKCIPIYMEKDEGKKADLKKKFKEEQLPAWVTGFDKVLEGYKNYEKKGELTLAEICTYNVMEMIKRIVGPDGIKVSAKIQAFVDKVTANDKIKAWIEKSQKKDTK